MTEGPDKTKVPRRLAAILAADIAGYSTLMGADEARTVRDLKDHLAVVLPMVSGHGGRVIDTAGDGILAEFGSVVNAVECAVAIQKAMRTRNAQAEEDRRMQFRIGINIGDVIHDEARVYGDGVNVAARLEATAEPGGISISGAVYDQVRNKLAVNVTDLGLQSLKNIADPVRVYRITTEPYFAPAQPKTLLALPDKPSIAVLPLTNLSRDLEQQYFSDGITEDIIAELSLFSELFVIARNSSFQYRGVDVRQVGRELGVRYLLEGSVRRSGERVRISMRLIECTTGRHLWTTRFDRNLTDIFEVQDEVAHNVALALAIKLTTGMRRRGKYQGTNSLECYDSFLRGREAYWQLTKHSHAQAELLLKRAIELDPNFSPPHALLAGLYLLSFINRWHEKADQYLEEAYQSAVKGVELDPTHPRALNSLASVNLWKRQHDEALVVYKSGGSGSLNRISASLSGNSCRG